METNPNQPKPTGGNWQQPEDPNPLHLLILLGLFSCCILLWLCAPSWDNKSETNQNQEAKSEMVY
jgi:hypothetical protein